MKEIDFLPEWYKSGQRREVNYRTMCLAFGGVFVVMMVWNFVATRSLSKAEAALAKMAPVRTEAEGVSRKFADLENKMSGLHKKLESVKRIDSKIDVASVLGELSFLVDEGVVLRKVDLIAEKFVARDDKPSAPGGALVRVAQSKPFANSMLPLGNVKFKVVISGLASDPADVAGLICRLDESPYFCQVVLSFSQNAKIRLDRSAANGQSKTQNGPPGNAADVKATDFEVTCYLANYRLK